MAKFSVHTNDGSASEKKCENQSSLNTPATYQAGIGAGQNS